MKQLIKLAAGFSLAASLVACSGSSDSNSPTNSQGSDTAQYRITFSPTWNSRDFATNFPGGPHFSPLIGATHNAQTIIWRPEDQPSTAGIESMAETGATGTLRSELQLRRDQGTVDQIFTGSLLNSPGSVSVTVTVSQAHPLVSVVSMLAPSPDWFVGVRDVSLRENDQWVNNLSFNLALYDAGTDLGERYTSVNQDGGDRIIRRLTSDAADTDFNNGVHRDSGAFVGTLQIRRL